MDAGSPVNVGAVTMGTHNGTHADAPFHFLVDGTHIDALDFSVYVGPAVVAGVTGAGGAPGAGVTCFGIVPASQEGCPCP